MTGKTFVEDILRAVDGDKDAPIAIICRTGNRTTDTQKALQEIGFTQVYNAKEGMAGSGRSFRDGIDVTGVGRLRQRLKPGAHPARVDPVRVL